jgi:hypothetical protein
MTVILNVTGDEKFVMMDGRKPKPPTTSKPTKEFSF